MLQLKNKTPFKAGIALFPDADGVDTLYVAVRATFTVRGGLIAEAEEQEPLKLADEYWGEPGSSSLKHAADLHLGKPATDVALVGEAVAPEGKPATQLDVTVIAGPVRKTVRVFGDREWRGPLDRSISPPAPFTRMPLVYERAFGGVLSYDAKKDQAILDWRNPVGVGFGLRKGPEDRIQKSLPNLEDPTKLISSPGDKPPPAGFGFIAPSWEPRRRYAGTYDQAWQDTRAPYLPKDFQPRFFNAAHPDLVYPGYMRGGEPVEVRNASLDPFSFSLPRCRIEVGVRIGAELERPTMNLQTLVLEPGARRLGLVWLGAVGCDKRTLKVQEVLIDLTRPDNGGGRA